MSTVPVGPVAGGRLFDRDELARLRACTALAYQLPGMLLFVDDASGSRTFRAGFPSNRYVTRHVADLRRAIGAAGGQDDPAPIERVLRFPLEGCSATVVSGTDAVRHVGDGVWRLSSLGTVTFVAVSVELPSVVTAAAGVLDVLADLEVTVLPDEALAVLTVLVDVDPDTDRLGVLEAEVRSVLGPVAFG